MYVVAVFMLCSSFVSGESFFNKNCMELGRKAGESKAKGCQFTMQNAHLSTADSVDKFGAVLPELVEMDRELNSSEICKLLQNISIVCEEVGTGSRFLMSPFLGSFIRNIISFRNSTCYRQGGIYNRPLGVCIRKFKKPPHRTVDMSVIHGLYVSGLIINPTCLLFIIFVYSYFDELRTVPGKNILCLAFVFLFSEVLEIILFFTDGEPKILCQAIAILRHWSMLGVFICLAVISFDLYVNFKSFKQCLKRTRKFKHYLIVVLMAPSVIVLVCVILEYGTTVHIGYGKIGQDCFMTGLLPAMITFFAPAFAISLSNIILMAVTIWRIRRNQREVSKVLKQGSLKKRPTIRCPILALKLSTILGVGWLCGLLGNLSQKPPLQYIYHCFINFFGVFLIIGFVATQRVCTLFKSKIQRKPKCSSFANLGLHNMAADSSEVDKNCSKEMASMGRIPRNTEKRPITV